MTFVEHTFPPFVWGIDLRVEREGDRLGISGIRPFSDDEVKAAPDLFRAYREAMAPFGPEKRQGKNSPHIEFANADTDQKLVRFVETFGPVVVNSLRTEERSAASSHVPEFEVSRTFLFAHQDMTELRNEHAAYRAALMLVSQLSRNKEADVSLIQSCIRQLAYKISDWPNQWERERRLRNINQGYVKDPRWMFGPDNVRHINTWKYHADDNSSNVFGGPNAIAAAHLVICDVVNAFSPLVYPWGKNPVEAPHWDLIGGIRPVLYYILRREYLYGSGIAICRNTECRHLFEIERAGQEFCRDRCSQRQRQREYWMKRGKKLRKQRLVKKAASSPARGNKKSYSRRKEGSL